MCFLTVMILDQIMTAYLKIKIFNSTEQWLNNLDQAITGYVWSKSSLLSRLLRSSKFTDLTFKVPKPQTKFTSAKFQISYSSKLCHFEKSKPISKQCRPRWGSSFWAASACSTLFPNECWPRWGSSLWAISSWATLFANSIFFCLFLSRKG